MDEIVLAYQFRAGNLRVADYPNLLAIGAAGLNQQLTMASSVPNDE